MKKNYIYFLFIIFSAFFISSAFYTLTFLNIPFGTFIPFSLSFLFIASHYIALNGTKSIKTILKRSFLSMWFFGFLVQLIAFFWITKPILYFGSVPWYFCYPLYFLISILTSLFFPLLFFPFILSLCFRCKFQNKKIYLLPIALCLTLFEMFIPRFFDWSFGALLSSNLEFSQLGCLLGFNTGSFFVFYTSILVYGFVAFKKNNLKFDFKYLTVCFFVVISAFFFGQNRVTILSKSLEQSQKVRVAFIQPNFTFNSLASLPIPSNDSKLFSFSDMLALSEKVIQNSLNFDGKKPELVVWPESTAPNFIFMTPWQINKVKELSLKYQVPFLIQSVEMNLLDVEKYGINNVPIWSSSAVINSAGLVPQFFAKWIPMPFGEEFPLENIFPFLGKLYRSLFANASKLQRGSHYQALSIQKGIYVTPLICFDTISQKLSYLSVKKGNSNFFINQANFVWMVDSNAGLELALLDQMRAIENARSVIVASNTGPSLVFDPLGRLLLPPTKLLTESIHFVDIPLYTGKTLFQKVYFWPFVILGLFSLCYLIYMARKLYVYK